MSHFDAMATWVRQHPRLNALKGLLRGDSVIALDYPVKPRPRWGHGVPPHPELAAMLARNESHYHDLLTTFTRLQNAYAAIPLTSTATTPHAPFWHNQYLPGLDAIALYAFTAHRQPQHYLEVGSGMSTRFVAQAITDHNLTTKIISVDPHPRADITGLCDTTIRQPLEESNLDIFTQLRPGDIVFIDNSHQSFPNSDVTVFFLEILPHLPSGVLVGIHDIFLPDDYPPSVAALYYSEQYLLAAYLLGGAARLSIKLPAWYVSHAPTFRADLAALYIDSRLTNVPPHGGGFWFEMTQPRSE